MALKDLMNRGDRPEVAETIEAKPIAASAAPAAPATPKPASAPRPSAAPATVLDATTRFEGVIRCEGSIRVDGQVQGEIHATQSVIVGRPAVLKAAIEADQAVIAGEVRGDITAIRKITLEDTARVTGNLCTPGIVIQEGAVLEGRIMIGKDAEPPAQEAPKAETAKANEPAKAAAKPDSGSRPPSAGSPPPAS